MSIEALSWAFNLDLPNSGIKLTLLALANYANEENCTAYPSQKTISQKTCLSTRAIRSHLVALEELGVISRASRKREDGTFTSDLFTLNVGFSPPKSTGRNYQRQNLPSAKNNHIQRQNLPHPAAKSAYQEPSLNTTKAKEETHTHTRPIVSQDSTETPENNVCSNSLLKPGTAGSVCHAIRHHGIPDSNPHHPILLALIDAGATEEEFSYAARTAVQKGKASFSYVVGMVRRQREDAAKLVLHHGRMPNKQEALEASNRAATEGWVPPELREVNRVYK